MPEVRVQQSFEINGDDQIVENEALWAEGARVTLRRGNPEAPTEIELIEGKPGRFTAPEGTPPPRRGEALTLDVRWRELSAQATAHIPDPQGTWQVTVNYFRPEDRPLMLYNHETAQVDTFYAFSGGLAAHNADPPALFFGAVTLPSTEALRARYTGTGVLLPNPFYSAPFDFEADRGFSMGFSAFSAQETPEAFEVEAILVTPEPIYGEYLATRSDPLAPLTITNVENGAGLVVGAVRDTVRITVPVNYDEGEDA